LFAPFAPQLVDWDEPSQWIIVKQNSLDTLDLRQPLDETLKTFPLDGWREIIQIEREREPPQLWRLAKPVLYHQIPTVFLVVQFHP
jgi:hypothetical protein